MNDEVDVSEQSETPRADPGQSDWFLAALYQRSQVLTFGDSVQSSPACRQSWPGLSRPSVPPPV